MALPNIKSVVGDGPQNTLSAPSAQRRRAAALGIAVALAAVAVAPTAWAYTQSGFGLGFGNGVPMGHEWVTRLGLLEVIGGDPIMKPDPSDPRLHWRQGLAKNLSLAGAEAEVARIKANGYRDERYQSTYRAAYDAIMGERWVDIAGFNVTNGKIGGVDCWDAVAQEAVEVQYDHFMRRYDDVGGDGGANAAAQSRQRFVDYFVNAAVAPATQVLTWDGGGSSAQVQVDRNYFLFGRAVHLFQDSFSTEHTVRLPDDNYTTIRQVKSYLCAPGSEQHSHDVAAILAYSSGDVIWTPGTQLQSGWSSYKPSNMKTPALVATEASKDLWAAFIRTMALPMTQREVAARREAATLADNWLSFDANAMRQWYDADGHRDRTYVLMAGQTGPGQTQEACMKNIGYASQQQAVDRFRSEQKLCLFNIQSVPGYADLFDTSTHMPFNWQWVSTQWQQPPASWNIPQRPADTGRRVQIRNANGNNLGAPDGLASNNWLYVRPSLVPIDLIAVDAPEGGQYYRATAAPALFMSYTATTGAVKLYNSPYQASFNLAPQAAGRFGIQSLYWKQWMWLDGQSPYISAKGNPGNGNAQWYVAPTP